MLYFFQQYNFVTSILEFTVPKSKDAASKKVNSERREGHHKFTVPKSKDSTSQKAKIKREIKASPMKEEAQK